MSNGKVNYQNSCSGAVKEPILSREEVERAWAISNGMVLRGNVSEDQLVAFAAALESALLEKLCREPVAWMVLECVHLKPCSVTLDREDIEGHRPEHVISLYALNRSKA
ncbi:TPA: hypothetical protein QDA93_002391 [Burkholderia vietnamiensis]|nr:hypothetical protein [Burkholderia vietnamiensis]